MSPWLFVLALFVVLAVLARADVQLRRHYAAQRCRRDASQQECSEGLGRLGFQSLEEYRGSELWRQTRRRYHNSDYPQRCLVCGSPDFDLHHRSYARLGHEELFDLVPLCRRHHDQLHELLDPHPDLCVKDTHDYLVLLKEGNESRASLPHVQLALPLGELRREPGAPVARHKRSQGGKKWSPTEDAALLRSFHRGISVEQLAEQLGRGTRAVEVRLFKLGALSSKQLGGYADDGEEQSVEG